MVNGPEMSTTKSHYFLFYTLSRDDNRLRKKAGNDLTPFDYFLSVILQIRDIELMLG